MNQIYSLTKGEFKELYFVHASTSQETVEKDLEEFRNAGWKDVLLMEVEDEMYYKLKFETVLNKHITYLGIYEEGANCETEEGQTVASQELVISTAKTLVNIARKAMRKDYDIEIPELVHYYLMKYDREDPQTFEEAVLNR
jgi:hypothetical protein